MALEGSIRDFGLADVLQLIFFHKKTGVLLIKSRTEVVRLTFRDGNVVSAESRDRTEEQKIGRILLNSGMVSSQDIDKALVEQKRTGARLAGILFKKGLVGAEDLKKALAAQVSDTVNRLFSWKEGIYEFEGRNIMPDKDISISLDTQQLLMDGLRVIDEWSEFKGRIMPETVFEMASPGAGDLTGSLRAEEKGILKFIDGKNDVAAIIELSGIDDYEALRILALLSERGAVSAREMPAATGAAAGSPLPIPRRHARFLSLALFAAALVSVASAALNKESPLSLSVFWDASLCHRLKTVKEIDKLRFLSNVYRYEHGLYPSGLDKIGRTNDMWGRPFEYKIANEDVLIRSSGPDGRIGTGDDIY